MDITASLRDVIKANHVRRACRRAMREGIPPRREARHTHIVYRDRRLPAKYILGLAYKFATGRELSPEAFTGGRRAADVLERMGFEVITVPTKTAGGARKRKCTPAKANFLAMLRKRFGTVETEKQFSWLVVPPRGKGLPALKAVHDALVRMRGNKSFATSGRELRCDYYLEDHGVVVEVDERQHFTRARAVALAHYPKGDKASLGFDLADWIKKCRIISAVDNDPLYRDEQRAYYDATRDILVPIHLFSPVVRVYAEDLENDRGLDRCLTKVSRAARRTREETIGRIVIKGPAPGSASAGRKVLLKSLERLWPANAKVRFLITPGGFLRARYPRRWDRNTGWVSRPEDIDPLVESAEQVLRDALAPSVLSSAKGKADVITVGVDVEDAEGQIRGELVAVFDVNRRKVMKWTGKSFPTSKEERTLVQVADLESHFLEVRGESVLVLGCHDLMIFSPRGASKRIPGSSRDKRARKMDALVKQRRPAIVLQHPHNTYKTRTWQQPWSSLTDNRAYIRAWASGICYNPKGARSSLAQVLDTTQSADARCLDIVTVSDVGC